MLYPTNKQEAFKFVTFLEEGLTYVDLWTPTDINSGGCGVFALLLVNKLEEYKIPYEIIGLCISNDRKKEMMADPRAKKLVETMPYDHFVIKIESLYFDSKGIENPMVSISKTNIITKEQLQAWVDSKEDIWNPTYDRTCNDTIKQRLEEIFSKYDNFKEGDFKLPKNGEVRYTDHTIASKKMEQSMSMLSGLFG